MLNTGKITFIAESSGGFDGDGDPIAPSLTSYGPIDGNIKTVTKGYQFPSATNNTSDVSGQEFIQAKYSVVFESSLFSALEIPGNLYQKVELFRNGVSLGIYRVINSEPLRFVDKVKVIV